MNHRLECFALLLLLFKCSSTEEPGIKRCVRGYELSFFYSLKNNIDAKQACKSYGNSRLVKVDNADITTVIDSLTDSRYKIAFYIDGHADSKRKFTWSDGSEVNLREENGYQNWADNQPNFDRGNEACIVVGRKAKKWKDSRCNELLHYICQKAQDPCITVNSTTPYVHRCIATGSMEPHVGWLRNGIDISNTPDQTIYQTKVQGITTLYYENATISDAGIYVCYARIDNGAHCKVTEQVKVNGTPSIINIKSFKCNSSLLIIWKPSALGLPHRINVSSNRIVSNLFITPSNNTKYFTEVSQLQSTTKYKVEITACSKKDKCPVYYAVHRYATTNGIRKSVVNASIEQLGGNNTCFLSWEWPYITSKVNVMQFKIIIRSGSTETSSNDDIRFVNIPTSNYSYSFEPQPSETYSVEIQSIESVGSCKTVHAIGSCIGKDAIIQSSSTTDMFTDANNQSSSTTDMFTDANNQSSSTTDIFTDANIQPSSTTDMFTDANIQSSSPTNILSIILPVAGGVFILIVVIVVALLIRKRKNTTARNTTLNLTSEVNNRHDEEVYTEPEYCNVHKYETVQNVQITASQSNVDVMYTNVHQYEAVQNVQITESNVDAVYTNINPTSGLANDAYEYDN